MKKSAAPVQASLSAPASERPARGDRKASRSPAAAWLQKSAGNRAIDSLLAQERPVDPASPVDHVRRALQTPALRLTTEIRSLVAARTNARTIHKLPREVEETEQSTPHTDAALARSGLPLDSSARRYLEARLGHDFGRVRVHVDDAAAASVAAHAFTVGEHIVFAAGQYRPQSRSGLRLLAHELTHVVQQSNPGSAGSTSSLEAEAEAAGGRVSGGGLVRIAGAASRGGLQRHKDENAASDIRVVPKENGRVAIALARKGVIVQGYAEIQPPPNVSAADAANQIQVRVHIAARGLPEVDIFVPRDWGRFLNPAAKVKVWDMSALASVLDREKHDAEDTPEKRRARLAAQLKNVNEELGTSEGVRSPKATEALKKKRQQLETQLYGITTEQLDQNAKKVSGDFFRDLATNPDSWAEGANQQKKDLREQREHAAAIEAQAPEAQAVQKKRDELAKNKVYDVSHPSWDTKEGASDALVKAGVPAAVVKRPQTGFEQELRSAKQVRLSERGLLLEPVPAGQLSPLVDPASGEVIGYAGRVLSDLTICDVNGQIVQKGDVPTTPSEFNVDDMVLIGWDLVDVGAKVAVEAVSAASRAPLKRIGRTLIRRLREVAAAAVIGTAEAVPVLANEVPAKALIRAEEAAGRELGAELSKPFKSGAAKAVAKPGEKAAAQGFKRVEGSTARELGEELSKPAKMEASAATPNAARAAGSLPRAPGPITGPTAGWRRTMSSYGSQVKSFFAPLTGGGKSQVEGRVFQTHDMAIAEAMVEDWIARSPGREVGLWRNPGTGAIRVVQGTGDWVQGGVNQVPSAFGPWEFIEHFHPDRNFVANMPSTNDFQYLEALEQANQGGAIVRPATSKIRYRDASTGQFHFTEYGINPAGTGNARYFVRSHTRSGAPIDMSFDTVGQWQQHLNQIGVKGSGWATF